MLRVLSLLGTLSAAWAATLILYQHSGHRGAYRILRGPTPSFRSINFNDEVSSVYASGDWELYEHGNYEGSRMVVESGHNINVYQNDFYSSARPLCEYTEDPTTAKLTIYEHSSSQGRSKEFLGPSDSLGVWNDMLSSVYAEKGDWELYKDDNFEGVREVVHQGQSRNVGRNDFYSSLRPVCESYASNSKCILEKIEVVDNGQINPVKEGTEIIGSASSGSCYSSGSHKLTLSSADSVEESFSLETSDTMEVNWHLTAFVQVEGSVKFLGSGSSITVGVETGAGGSITMGTSETKSFTEGNEKLVGLSTTFSLPGAALVFGSVDRYTIDKSDAPVKMHMKCPDGSKPIRMSTMTMKSVTYPSADFWTLTGRFNSAACKADRFLPHCVRGVKNQYSHYIGKRQEIVDAFDRCFADGKGSIDKLKNRQVQE